MRYLMSIPNFGDAQTVAWVATAAVLATSRIKLGPSLRG
jgi:hypothetical protein